MKISPERFEAWSNFPSTNMYKNTHESIRKAIKNYNDFPENSTIAEPFLQGSYANHTNIRANSDVDVVIKLVSSFAYDISDLQPTEKELYAKEHVPAIYNWTKFREDVVRALEKHYGDNTVDPNVSKKCVKVKAKSGRVDADVVVCLEHRKYYSYNIYRRDNMVKGIGIWHPDEKRWIVNYPKQHKENGGKKNTLTKNRYKRAVRIFKNAYRYLVDMGYIDENLASSYAIECLLYNVQNERFTNSCKGTYYEVVTWLSSHKDISYFKCQNEVVSLDRVGKIASKTVTKRNDPISICRGFLPQP